MISRNAIGTVAAARKVRPVQRRPSGAAAAAAAAAAVVHQNAVAVRSSVGLCGYPRRMVLMTPLLAAGSLHCYFSTQHVSGKGGGGRDSETTKAENRRDGDDKAGSEDKRTLNMHWNNAKEYLETNIFNNSGKEGGEQSKKAVGGGEESPDYSSGGSSFWNMMKNSLPFTSSNTDDNADRSFNKENQETEQNLQAMQSRLLGMLGAGFSGKQQQQKMVEDLVSQARSSSEQGDVSDSISLDEVLTIMRTVKEEFDQTFQKHLDGIQKLPSILPTNLYYFLEYQDQVKNYSWRRRRHRFCRGINLDYVNELNYYMEIAKIGYEDDMEYIQDRLSEVFGYEVIYCRMDSLPGQPSHFLAIKKDQSHWSDSLEMIMCVRGTKTITDVITDLLGDEVQYREGKAHSGICQGGKYLAEEHMDTFQELLEASGKSKIKLTLVGHSLGAGAASIAGIELHDHDDFDVQVIGFGCPSLLSKELSESTKDFITTVVADNDCIPRMSLATMMNALLDIGEYDWVRNAEQDLEDAIDQVQDALPTIITDSVKDKLLKMLSTKVLATVEIPPATTERMEPVLFPPGKCIHFYRDGFGLSGAIVPCTFFHELDVNRRMVHDHLFDTGYRPIFLDLMRQYKGDNFFRFEHQA